jgi:hypothetical protein
MVGMEQLVEVQTFDSPEHFASFKQLVEAAVNDGDLEEVEVNVPYASLMLDERWYRSAAGQIWRLVKPEFPFKGVFLKVK